MPIGKGHLHTSEVFVNQKKNNVGIPFGEIKKSFMTPLPEKLNFSNSQNEQQGSAANTKSRNPFSPGFWG